MAVLGLAGEHRSGEAWTGRVCFVQVRSVVVRQVSLWQGENGSVEDEWGKAVEARNISTVRARLVWFNKSRPKVEFLGSSGHFPDYPNE